MKILVDGDSCNRLAFIEKCAKQRNIPVHIFCDSTRYLESDYSEIHICDKGKDSADFAILKYTEKGDVVVTKDSGLASMALSKKAFVIHFNGMQFNKTNINSFLTRRYIRNQATMDNKKKQCKGFENNNNQNKHKYYFKDEFPKLLNYASREKDEEFIQNERAE